MSIASEITRLQTAKADIKTSIEAKGVTVPSSAKLDDYSDYVDQIQTGGGSSKLPEVVNKTVTTISANDLGNITNIGEYSFYNCSSLTSIIIPNSVTSIGQSAFYGCSSLTSIDLTNCTSIGQQAFVLCSGLTSVTIPNTVTSFDYGIFASCTNLASCTFNANITTIPGTTFFNCSSLTSFVVPSTVTAIGSNGQSAAYYNAFGNCTSLTSFTIPTSVTLIGRQCFDGCTNLTEITYLGTMAQWGSITLGTNWKRNTPLATIHCSDGDITL